MNRSVPFADRLAERIRTRRNALCVGLDPRLPWLPEEFAGLDAVAAVTAFNRAVIDQVADLAVAVKPQVAFFECLGETGLVAFADACRHARDRGLLVIADVKRGDIGSTAEAYAAAYLGGFPGGDAAPFACDALTVSPYLGFDTLHPFIEAAKAHGKGVFVLVKTTNPGAADLQDLENDGEPVHHAVARFVAKAGTALCGAGDLSGLGAVVGAQYPDQARRLRELMPRAFFLVPGYGAQGGSADDAFAGALTGRRGVLVASARGVQFAFRGPTASTRHGASWRDLVREAAERAARDLAVA